MNYKNFTREELTEILTLLNPVENVLSDSDKLKLKEKDGVVSDVRKMIDEIPVYNKHEEISEYWYRENVLKTFILRSQKLEGEQKKSPSPEHRTGKTELSLIKKLHRDISALPTIGEEYAGAVGIDMGANNFKDDVLYILEESSKNFDKVVLMEAIQRKYKQENVLKSSASVQEKTHKNMFKP